MPSYSDNEPEEPGPFDVSLWMGEDQNLVTGNDFTAEIENVNESDWDVDSDALWGADTAAAATIDDAAPDFLV